MRSTIRDILTAIFVALTLPLWGTVLLLKIRGLEMGVFVTVSQALSLLPGTIGVILRRAYYIMTLESCAKDIGIGFGSWFSKRNVKISPRVSVGAHCLIGTCCIGEGTLLGSNIDILSGRHQHSLNSVARENTKHTSNLVRVHIAKNAWIGNRTIIMADVGENSVIGAGSVVVHSIPSNAIAVGNPAKVMRHM